MSSTAAHGSALFCSALARSIPSRKTQCAKARNQAPDSDMEHPSRDGTKHDAACPDLARTKVPRSRAVPKKGELAGRGWISPPDSVPGPLLRPAPPSTRRCRPPCGAAPRVATKFRATFIANPNRSHVLPNRNHLPPIGRCSKFQLRRHLRRQRQSRRGTLQQSSRLRL